MERRSRASSRASSRHNSRHSSKAPSSEPRSVVELAPSSQPDSMESIIQEYAQKAPQMSSMEKEQWVKLNRHHLRNIPRATWDILRGRTPQGLEDVSAPTNAAIRDLQKRYARYGKGLKNIRSIDDLIDLNKKEFGSGLAGGENLLGGAVFGYCSGFAVRAISKKVAVLFGVAFIGLQLMNYRGYISVKWDTIRGKLTDVADLNDDGVVDHKDFEIARKKLYDILTFGLPSTAGFSAGFIWGYKGKLL